MIYYKIVNGNIELNPITQEENFTYFTPTTRINPLDNPIEIREKEKTRYLQALLRCPPLATELTKLKKSILLRSEEIPGFLRSSYGSIIEDEIRERNRNMMRRKSTYTRL